MGTNVVVLEGALGRDAEQKFTTTGKSVTNFSLAVDNGYGENKKPPHWATIVAWNEVADQAAKLTKGSKVTVYGRFTTRKYTNKTGVEVTVTEFVANAIAVRDGQPKQQAPAAQGQEIDDSSIPF